MAQDARISTAFPHHPKTKKLRRRLGDSGPLACMYLFLWAAANRSDGDLSGMSDEDIELAVDWQGGAGEFVAEMAAVGFLDGDEGSRRIHDWAKHNPWAAGAEGRSERARAAAAKKWGVDLAAVNRKKRSERLSEARRKGTHTKEEWDALVDVCGGKCLRCGSESEIVKDHILPIVHGGSDSIENLQPLCRSCNASKTDAIDSRPAGWARMLAERLRNACVTPADSKMTPAPSPSPSPSPIESTIVDLSPEPAEPDSEDGIPRCPVKKIVALYHEILPELPPVLELPEQTVKCLRQRWRSDPQRQSLDWWRKFFEYVRECPFLMGEKTDFTADLLWLVRPTNFAKVLNGN